MKLYASAAEQWGPERCPASPKLQLAHGAPYEQSQKQREGDAAHHVVAQILRGEPVPLGTTAPNGVIITAEMVDCATDIVRDVTDTLRTASPNSLLYVEFPFNPANEIAGNNYGRGDVVIYDADRRVVYLWEYKYGHRFVDAFRNWQLINFAAGVMEWAGVPSTSWSQWKFVCTVCQPRNYHHLGQVREWHTSGDEMAALVHDLSQAAFEANSLSPTARTGTHCRDCSARHACDVLIDVAQNLIDESFEPTPAELPPAALGLMLKNAREAIKRLGALAEGLEEQAKMVVQAGGTIPHWRGDYTTGRERWTVTAQEVIATGQMCGVDLSKPTTLTPLQAKKAGVDSAIVDALTERPRGGLTLQPFSTDDALRRFT